MTTPEILPWEHPFDAWLRARREGEAKFPHLERFDETKVPPRPAHFTIMGTDAWAAYEEGRTHADCTRDFAADLSWSKAVSELVRAFVEAERREIDQRLAGYRAAMAFGVKPSNA